MANAATLDYLLGQMAQDKEVLNGWDAVLNITESAINAFLLAQFQKMASSGQQMLVSQVFCGPRLISPHGDYCVVTEFSFALSAPSFVFTGGSNTVTVTQVIASGSTRAGTMPVGAGFQPASCGCTPNDPRVTWGPVQTVAVGNSPAVSAQVQLTSITGLINASTHTIVLDFAKGVFTTRNITLQGVTSQELSDQIKNWFATHGVKYQLASLDFSAGGSIPSLTPTQFQFTVLKTNAGNIIVQILITTNGKPSRGYPIVLEPVPTEDGYNCSLMISSRIVFSDILCAGFNGAQKPFKLYPQISPGTQNYTAQIAPPMHFSGSFSYGSCCSPTTVTYSLYLGGTYLGTATAGFHLYQTITPSGNVGNTITVSGDNPISLGGSGAGQSIRINPQPPSVNVTGGASDTINSSLKAILNDDFVSVMSGISFQSVTYFALRSVLFPGNLLAMKVAQVPTDMVLVGTFTPN